MLRRFSSSVSHSLYANAGRGGVFKTDPGKIALPKDKLLVCPSGKVRVVGR